MTFDVIKKIRQRAAEQDIAAPVAGPSPGAPAGMPRFISGDPLTTSIGEFYLQQLTPAELRADVARVTAALGGPSLPEVQRMTLEMNLQAMEDYAAAQGIDLPSAAGYHLRQVMTPLSEGLLGLINEFRTIIEINEHYGQTIVSFGSPFIGEVNWAYNQLDWMASALSEAVSMTSEGENGGPESAQKFSMAGTRMTAVMFGSQALAVHLAFLHVGFAAAQELNPLAGVRLKDRVAMVSDAFRPQMLLLRTLEPHLVQQAVTALQDRDLNFEWSFSQWVDDLDDEIRSLHRLRQIVNIAMLAMSLRSLLRPSGLFGGGGGGGALGPTSLAPAMAGASGGTVAVVGLVESAEAAEALRRLAAIGAISTAALGQVGVTPPKISASPLPGGSSAAQSWEELEASAENAPRRRPTGGFGARSVRSGNREVVIVEGEVGPPVADTKFVDKVRASGTTGPGEHASHAVGAQSGENLPEGLTSGPGATLNLSLVKRVENATRAAYEAALGEGGTVETRTTAHVEYRLVGGEEVPYLTNLRREAWLRVLGTDQTSASFIDFEASIDPVTREVTVIRNAIRRP